MNLQNGLMFVLMGIYVEGKPRNSDEVDRVARGYTDWSQWLEGRVQMLESKVEMMQSEINTLRSKVKDEPGDGSGSLQPGNKLYWDINLRANSTWSDSYAAEKAMKGEGGYWCSAKNDKAPVVWWISFKQQPVKILSIKFEEVYPGAEYEFFASDTSTTLSHQTPGFPSSLVTNECDPDLDRTLLKGDLNQINGAIVENGQLNRCYGLKITKLGDGGKNGPLASLKNFQFFVDNGAVADVGVELVDEFENKFNKEPNREEGLLLVRDEDGKWGTVCENNGGENDNSRALADVICRELGTQEGQVLHKHKYFFDVPFDKAHPTKYDYFCKGDEKSIYDCENRARSDDCEVEKRVAIKCLKD